MSLFHPYYWTFTGCNILGQLLFSFISWKQFSIFSDFYWGWWEVTCESNWHPFEDYLPFSFGCFSDFVFFCKIFVCVCVSYWHLMNNKCRERLSLNSPCLSKDIASKGAQLAYIPYPGMLSTTEDGLITGEEITPTRQTLSQAIYHIFHRFF